MTAVVLTPCRWCGQSHSPIPCPYVKALEFENGTDLVRRVEFFSQKELNLDTVEAPPEQDYPRLGEVGANGHRNRRQENG